MITLMLMAILGVQDEEKEWDKRIKQLPNPFREQKALLTRKGEKFGEGTLNTLYENGTVYLNDQFSLKAEGSEFNLRIIQAITLNRYLSVKSAEFTIKAKQTLQFKATVKDGKISVTADGRTRSVALTKKTVTNMALLRIVALVPQRKGFKFEFDLLELMELRLKKDHSIICQGEEEIKIADKKVKAVKWAHFVWVDEKEGPVFQEKHYYWVSGGVCVVALLDGTKKFTFTRP